MRAMLAVVLVLALGCEDDNPARRDGEGGSGGAGGFGGSAGEGGAGGEGGAEVEPDAAPLPEPGWSDAGLWIGWPDDPSDMDRTYHCSERCGGCREIVLLDDVGMPIQRPGPGAPMMRIPVNARLEYGYRMRFGDCPAVGFLTAPLPHEGGPYVYELPGGYGRIQVSPTGEDGRGKFIIETGPYPFILRFQLLWPNRVAGEFYAFHVVD